VTHRPVPDRLHALDVRLPHPRGTVVAWRRCSRNWELYRRLRTWPYVPRNFQTYFYHGRDENASSLYSDRRRREDSSGRSFSLSSSSSSLPRSLTFSRHGIPAHPRAPRTRSSCSREGRGGSRRDSAPGPAARRENCTSSRGAEGPRRADRAEGLRIPAEALSRVFTWRGGPRTRSKTPSPRNPRWGAEILLGHPRDLGLSHPPRGPRLSNRSFRDVSALHGRVRPEGRGRSPGGGRGWQLHRGWKYWGYRILLRWE